MTNKLNTPWQFEKFAPIAVFDSNGEEVVTIYEHYSTGIPKAALITAAPELLKVAAALTDAIDNLRMSGAIGSKPSDPGTILSVEAHKVLDPLIEIMQQGDGDA